MKKAFKKAVRFWFEHPACLLISVVITFIGTLIHPAIGMVLCFLALGGFASYDMNAE